MPVYLFWGEGDFALNRAVVALRDRTVDPEWASFNVDKVTPEQPDAVIQGLNLAMSLPFGAGGRLVWLAETTVCQRCPDEVLSELERSLPVLPETTVLLLTTSSKPDGRLKSTKLLQRVADIREFSPISPWKTDLLQQQVRQATQEVGVKLTAGALQRLTESVGNNSRQLYSELEKLRLYAEMGQEDTGKPNGAPLDEAAVAVLVTNYTQNSLQLAAAIRQGDTGTALSLVADLLRHNEPPPRIVATLVGQFRMWLWIKLMLEAGERDDKVIARAAEIDNPKRLYFLRKEIEPLSLNALQRTLPLLLELEFGLKRGAEPMSLLQTKIIELCQLHQAPVRTGRSPSRF